MNMDIQLRPSPTLPLWRPLWLAALLIAPLSLTAGDAPPPPKVPVQTLNLQDVAIYKTYTGRTEANRRVDVRAQVGGILESKDYIEGTVVEQGDLLFSIDDRPFAATVNEANADLTAARAAERAAQRDWDRISSLFDRGVASEKDRDDARSALDTAQAEVAVARAKLESAQINLDYTSVTAPLSGVAGLRQISEGNLINTGDALVRINEIDPIQVHFSYPADDRFARKPALNPTPSNPTPAEIIGLHSSAGSTIQGEINFRDSEISRETNSIALRGVFDNPDHLLRPNRFVQVRLLVDSPTDVIVIPEKAITPGIEPGTHAVFVLDEDNTAQQTRVTLGPQAAEGRIIESGLNAGDVIIIDGLVKVTDGITVDPATDNDTQ